ncbi:ribosome hibernation-promoting factor, HPF/YfiA family [Sphingomonas sp.]|jgi:ribosomal subunit interface protein|uniref:ribosome hibernation-promoting factor, HPF/YfiA family n=1 Tax=Sphingomonas sp. TaxID=28214 RepID=UPI002DE3697D|nr:ribosome-associated translation inhibitor RaiA [Sphingomonas sp.]HEV2569913.1 ribosome-associated translation inhibitor RaiA [Sphingomonas sp.]
MDVRVSGHQVDVGEALRKHASTRVQALSDKYDARAVSSTVTFGKGPHDHRFDCEIIIYVPNGVVLKGSSRATEAQPAFEDALSKIEKQVRRYMRRLRDRHGQGAAQEAAFDAAGYTVFSLPEAEEEEEIPDNPPIVAETRVDVPDASVSDAVMMLDLRNTNALLFKNSASGVFNMVYRRGDGTIGWVEPQRA